MAIDPITLAVIGGSALGGFLSGGSSRKANARAAAAAGQGIADAKEDRSFYRQEYKQSRRLFDSVAADIYDTVKRFDKKVLARRGAGRIRLAAQRSTQNAREILNRRGLQDSGLAAQTELEIQANKAIRLAENEFDAELKALQVQQDFYKLGVSEQQALLSAQVSAGSRVTQGYGQLAQVHSQRAQQQGDLASKFFGTAVDLAGAAAGLNVGGSS